MRPLRWISLFLLPSLFLASCVNHESSNVILSDSSLEDSIYDSSSDRSSSIVESTSVEQDEKGFCILPEGYLSPTTSKYSFGQKVGGVTLYDHLRLFAGDQEIPVYQVMTNNTYVWDPEAKNRTPNGVASLSLEGPITFTLLSTWRVNGHCIVSPLKADVSVSFDEPYKAVSFTISKPGDYTVEYRSNRTLHLFVHEYSTSEEYSQSNSIYFGPGLHDKNNDSRLSNNSILNVYSNQTVYLAEGAIVRGSIRSNSASNVKILGKGLLDGSVFERNANAGSVFVPIDFNDCSNIEFSSFGVIDPAGWCFNLYFCSNLLLDGVKVISSRSNGDGISLQSCQHAEVRHCFTRTYDDSIVVKNYPRWNNRSIEGTTKDINIHDCLVWTDLAQCLEIGYETVGEVMEDIHFENITVLHANHKAVISIHNANNANINNVTYENIMVEHLNVGQGDGSRYLIDFTVAHSSTWSDQHKVTGLGSTKNVSIKDVRVLSGINSPMINIQGSMETRSAYPNVAHKIEGVQMENIELKGAQIGQNYGNIELSLCSDIYLQGTKLA